MSLFLIILIGLALSMDSFSLSLSIGSFNISKRKIIIYSLIVGIFHFIMPILGYFLGNQIKTHFFINNNILLIAVLGFVEIEMIIDLFSKDNKEYNFNIINMLLCALSVSLDSFSIGLGFENLSYYPFIFCFISSFFTFIGLIIGKFAYNKLGIYSKIIGVIIIQIVIFLEVFN